MTLPLPAPCPSQPTGGNLTASRPRRRLYATPHTGGVAVSRQKAAARHQLGARIAPETMQLLDKIQAHFTATTDTGRPFTQSETITRIIRIVARQEGLLAPSATKSITPGRRT